MPRPRAILVVCIGNICRSPFAERRLRALLAGLPGAPIEIRSAGFGKWNRPSPPEAVAEAARRGVDLEPHRSRSLTHEAIDATDLFLVTDGHQERRLRREEGVDPRAIVHLGDLDPDPIRERTIVDPWGKGEEVFRESYERIERCLDALVAALSRDAAEPGGR